MNEQYVETLKNAINDYFLNKGVKWWRGDPIPDRIPVEAANAFLPQFSFPPEIAVKSLKTNLCPELRGLNDAEFLDSFEKALVSFLIVIPDTELQRFGTYGIAQELIQKHTHTQ